MPTGNNRRKVMVIGLDGATPEIIDRLIAAGQMPNMARLYQRGAHGVLKSVLPSISSLAWASFMTGNNPGKHGVFGFEGRTRGSYKTRLMLSGDIHSPSLWQLLSEAGKRVAAINVVMTYPPTPVNGIMVSGFLAPMEALFNNFTYPPDLAPELVRDGYKVEPEVLIYQSRKKYEEEVFAVMEKRAETALRILGQEDWDCFMVVFTATDRLQHRFWQMMEPQHFDVNPKDVERYGDTIYRCYRRLDEIIGQFVERANDNTDIMLMSDHGFGHATTNFNIHNWLVEQGLLQTKISTRKRMLLSRYRWLAVTLGKLRLLRLVSLARTRFPRLFQRMTAEFKIHDSIDWSQTKVYVVEKALYVNLKGRDPEGTVEPGAEYEELLASVKERLQAVKDPATGAPIVESVTRGTDMYQGRYAPEGGDLILRFHKGYRHWPRLAPGAPVITKEKVFCSYHHDHEDGFFAMAGPDIKKGVVSQASIMDLTPTILHALGVPIPEDMDGKPLTDLFDPDSLLSRQPVAYQAPENGRVRIRDAVRRLKASGRIGGAV